MTGPLSGQTIVNTRAPHQAKRLNDLLRQAGAEPLPYPCIDIELPTDTAPLDNALHQLAMGEYDWLLLTSRNTVESLRQRLHQLDLKLPRDMRIAAVGPGTAEATQSALSVPIGHLPPESLGESLADTLPEMDGQRVLLPQSAIAPPMVAERLSARGFEVTVVEAYHTVRGRGGVQLLPLLAEGAVSAICLTSGSTATHFAARLSEEGGNASDLAGCAVACIGPRTAEAARASGFPVTHVANPHTLEGLVAVLGRPRPNPKGFGNPSGFTSEAWWE